MIAMKIQFRQEDLEKFIIGISDNRSERMGVIHDDDVRNVNRKTTSQGFQLAPNDSISGQLVPIVSSPRLKPRLGNQSFDFILGDSERRSRFTDHVFFHHHGAEIVGSIAQRDLTDFRSLRYPGTLDIFNVV